MGVLSLFPPTSFLKRVTKEKNMARKILGVRF
jgi:hypothetical protein